MISTTQIIHTLQICIAKFTPKYVNHVLLHGISMQTYILAKYCSFIIMTGMYSRNQKKERDVITLQKATVNYSVYYTRTTQNYKYYYTKLQTVLHITTLYYGQNYLHMQHTQTKQVTLKAETMMQLRIIYT